MILTQCAACAAPLGLSLGKKCGRCSTRYCGPACQAQHWKEGGHDKLCKRIKKCGGAEQYYANQKHADAVKTATDACAEDTNGQTCYICTEAVHWKTKEGLVRGCACRGTAGFAHVSCLAEQAKILVAEAEENNLEIDPRFARRYRCSLCEQDYHGVVACALGWACWKTYVGRPETDQLQGMAMGQLGNGLYVSGHHEDALFVKEAELSMERRRGAPEENILVVQGNLASTYQKVGRLDEALRRRKVVYSDYVKLKGQDHELAILAAYNYATSLVSLKRFEEVKSWSRKTIPVARRGLGDSNELTLRMRWNYAMALYGDDGATLDDLREAVETLEETTRTSRRVFGGTHPTVPVIERSLRDAQAVLSARESRVSSG